MVLGEILISRNAEAESRLKIEMNRDGERVTVLESSNMVHWYHAAYPIKSVPKKACCDQKFSFVSDNCHAS